MNLAEAVALLAPTFTSPETPAIWADLGCGTGTFTRALARLVAPDSTILAIDSDQRALRRIASPTPRVTITTHTLDFVTGTWPFDVIDGILMANSLHYVADQPALLQRCARHLRQDGRLLLVEYDTARADRWVPYPIPMRRAESLLELAGFNAARLLGTRPSAYGRGDLYALVAERHGT